MVVLTQVATASADPPPISPQAQAAGFVDVLSVVPDAFIDLRYATPNNFVGQQLYPSGARCLIHQDLVPGVVTAADILRENGKVLVFWDCYRPHDVQVRMFAAVPNPNWVARPSEYARSHESGRSVDVTLADAHYGWRADFSPRSHANATEGVTAAQQANRERLRAAMAAGGLTVYSGEWWHFDGPGADVPRPILDVPVN
jgi:D-alanyl-D-alanine dipeptidase